MSGRRVPDNCPRCGAPTHAAVDVAINDDNTTYIYCSCGYVLDGDFNENENSSD